MEQLIARDTGNHVNLSEQDFMENAKLWNFQYYHDGGNPKDDLDDAVKNKYKFAYENQWDYNPSLKRKSDYSKSCTDYPPLEPGCSDSAPQAPEDCVLGFICFFYPAVLSGPRSPYMSNGAFSIWDPEFPDVSVAMIIIELASNNPVVLGYTLGTIPVSGGYIVNEPLSAGGNGGHVVHIVGYIDNAQLAANPATAHAPMGAGGGYFIIKNSLGGTCAGDLGYRYMPVAFLESRANGVFVLLSESH
jgi:hypothetical protein